MRRARGARLHQRDNAGAQFVQPRRRVDVGNSKLLGSGAGAGILITGGQLVEVEHVGVVAEVERAQFGMLRDAEPFPDQRVKMAGQKIGEVERAWVRLVVGGEDVAAVEVVAVGTGDAHHVGVAGQRLVQRARGAAVAVADQDDVELCGPRVHLGLHRGRNRLRCIMQLGRDRGQCEVPALEVGNGDQFAHNRAAGNDAEFHEEKQD